MNAHLKAIPSLGTFTARSLTGGDAEHFSRHADRALDLELLLLGTTDEVSADLLEVLDITGGEGDANAVNLRGISLLDSLLSNGFHNSGHLSNSPSQHQLGRSVTEGESTICNYNRKESGITAQRAFFMAAQAFEPAAAICTFSTTSHDLLSF